MLKRVTTIGLYTLNTPKNTVSTRLGTLYIVRDQTHSCRAMSSTPDKERSPFTIKTGLQFKYQQQFRSAGIIPIAIKKINEVDQLSANISNIRLSENTSNQSNTTTTPANNNNNTNASNNTENNNIGAATPVKENLTSSGSRSDSDIFVLMLREARPGSPFKTHPEYQGLSFPGGKIDAKDQQDPINTALREFNEETASIFVQHLDGIKQQLNDQFPKNAVYIRTGKYYLFTTQVPYIDIADNKFGAENTEEKLQGLCWIRLRDLVTAVNDKTAKSAVFDSRYYLHSFTHSILETPAVISLLRYTLQQFTEKNEFSLGMPKDGDLQRAIATRNIPVLSNLLLKYHEGDKHGLASLLIEICEHFESDPTPSPKSLENSPLPSEEQYQQRVKALTSPFKPFDGNKRNNRRNSPPRQKPPNHYYQRDQAKK